MKSKSLPPRLGAVFALASATQAGAASAPVPAKALMDDGARIIPPTSRRCPP